MTASTFDALIIGGGPGGATSALLLANAGWSVALVEGASFPRGKVCGEFLSATNFLLLKRLGISESFLELAGPEVREVGLFSGGHVVTSDTPRPPSGNGTGGLGRALGREHLDTLLLQRAAAAGTTVWQPMSAVELKKTSKGGYVCRVVCRKTGQSRELSAQIVIAAHGSWELGSLPTQVSRFPARPSELFGFKAHFLKSKLPVGLMPLLAFPGGYGGMVHSDHGRISLSCCIRRDQLRRIRSGAGRVHAGDALLAHIKASCSGVRETLLGAQMEGQWLSAGPIRPGIRGVGSDGIFQVGNAAGEAHPAIAEGIGMAMQSAWLLCDSLTARTTDLFSISGLERVRRDYSIAWRRKVAPRIRAASLIAQWAMQPAAVACAMPLLQLFPAVLTAGAQFSGKAVFRHQT